MATETERRPRRTADEWDALAREQIIPALRAGAKLKDVAEEHAKGYTNAIRKTLTRLGFDSKGQPLEIEPLESDRPDRLADKVIRRREAGASWRELEQATGQSTAKLKELLAGRGREDLTHGRGWETKATEPATD
jgi:hypothetical protein